MFLVTGSNGQLGTALQSLLKDQAVYIDKDELDLTNEEDVKHYLINNPFDCVINCAAYTAVDKAETDKETAQLKMMCTPQYLELVQAFITIVKKEDPRIKDQKTLLQVALNDYMQNHKKALDKAKSIVED